MKIISKKQANDILVSSLFNPGGTFNKGKFDSGKYIWHGSQKYYIGKDALNIPNVHAIYVERRQDKDGPYAQLMCIYN